MYVSPNYRTKKVVKEALALGADIWVYQPNAVNMDLNRTTPGETVHLEGPHYPEAHTWYGKGKVGVGGKLLSIR